MNSQTHQDVKEQLSSHLLARFDRKAFWYEESSSGKSYAPGVDQELLPLKAPLSPVIPELNGTFIRFGATHASAPAAHDPGFPDHPQIRKPDQGWQ